MRGPRLRAPSSTSLAPWSPFVKPELRFNNFAKHPGHVATLSGLLGLNVAVWAGWQSDDLNRTLWPHIFLWKNDWLEKGHYWQLVTPSFSHASWGHLVGNMTLMLYLGKRLHQFMGRARFLGLYLLGAAFGTIATELSPSYKMDSVALSTDRYVNIISDLPLGEARSLGASDSVMAFIAAWYLVFPRTPIHLFRTTALFQRSLNWAGVFPRLSSWIYRRNPTVSAIYLLPAYFVNDFLNIVKFDNSKAHYTPARINFFAHAGGFLAGVLYYCGSLHAIKAKFFAFTLYETSRRVAIGALTLGGYAWLVSAVEDEVEEPRVVQISIEALRAAGASREVITLGHRANTCAVHEARHPAQNRRIGRCDADFSAITEIFKALEMDKFGNAITLTPTSEL